MTGLTPPNELAGLIEAAKELQDDLLMRGERDSDGTVIVNASFSRWKRFCKALAAAQSLSPTEATEPLVERIIALGRDEAMFSVGLSYPDFETPVSPIVLGWVHKLAAALSSSISNAEVEEDDEGPCTDCYDTGITIQTERRCACQPPLTATEDSGEVVQADRQRAHDLLDGAAPDGLLEGKCDSLSLVQAFKRHRLAARQSPDSLVEALEPFAWVDGLKWHAPAHRAVVASVKLGAWLSAALDDPKVCDAMKTDIREWFSAGEPMEILGQAATHFASLSKSPSDGEGA